MSGTHGTLGPPAPDRPASTAAGRSRSPATGGTLGPLPADVWYLTGATAVGKSEAALTLAGRLGCEIVALDSMTLYRGLDVGTAKPSAADRARVPHHLIDVLDPEQSASLDWYVRRALACVAEIRGRGRQPLFVGGTPLYLKACLRGMFFGPAADGALRAELQSRGPAALHAELLDVDAAAAERIGPTDTRRLVRALEVHRLTGRPISEQQRQFARPADPMPKVACLTRPTAELNARIDARVLRMLDAGWIEEERRLQRDHPGRSRECRQAVGYATVAAFLAGTASRDGMVQTIRTRTRQFAKRQRTWFRGLDEVVAFETGDDVAARLEAFFTQGAVAG